MRLIDADRLEEEIKSLRCTLTGLRAGKGVLARAADEYRKTILQIIDDQPTAFDKEKVIEKINREIEYHHEKSKIASMEIRAYSDGAERAYRLLRNIVEKGGIE